MRSDRLIYEMKEPEIEFRQVENKEYEFKDEFI